MTPPKYDNQELRNKIDHEGGYADAFAYGILAEDIEDPLTAELWSIAATAWENFETTLRPLDERLPEVEW